jgi:hypothetical protein
MKTASANFNDIVESVYNLPLEFKEELKSLLAHNIADDRRSEIADNYKAAQKEQKAGKLKFSSSVGELKTML